MVRLLRSLISQARPNQKNPANAALATPTATPVILPKMRSNTINSPRPRLAMNGNKAHPARTVVACSRRGVASPASTIRCCIEGAIRHPIDSIINASAAQTRFFETDESESKPFWNTP